MGTNPRQLIRAYKRNLTLKKKKIKPISGLRLIYKARRQEICFALLVKFILKGVCLINKIKVELTKRWCGLQGHWNLGKIYKASPFIVCLGGWKAHPNTQLIGRAKLYFVLEQINT